MPEELVWCFLGSSSDSADLKKLVYPGICLVSPEGALNAKPHSLSTGLV